MTPSPFASAGAWRTITLSPSRDRDHRAETSSLRPLATMGEPMVALALRTDGTRLDVSGAHTRPNQEQLVCLRQRKPMAVAVRLERLGSIRSCYLAPGVGHVVTHVIATAPNCRTKNNVNIVGPRAKGRGHNRKRCTN